jgi:hypothetical protein
LSRESTPRLWISFAGQACDYGNEHRQCQVTIVVPAGKRIQLTFTTFNLDAGYSSINVSNVSNHIDGILLIKLKAHFFSFFIFLFKFTILFSPHSVE